MKKTMHRLLAATALALLAPFLLVVPAHAETPAPRVMVTGDSVTAGWAGDTTWRYHFSKARPDVDMVGNKTGTTSWGDWDYNGADAYADPDFDTGHAATYGGRLSDRNPDPKLGQLPIDALVDTYQPDTVIGLWGINDLNGGVTPQDLVSLYGQWINDARSARPGVDLIIGRLSQTWTPGVQEFNDLLPGLAARKSTAESRVVIATMTEAYAKGVDTNDDVHPNAQGEAKIAHQMLSALAELERLNTPPAPPETPAVAAAPAATVAPVTAAPSAPVLAKPGTPRKVAAVQHGRRVAVTWRSVSTAERYAVRCGTVTRWTTTVRASLRSEAPRCRVRAVNAAGVSPWAVARVRR